jgi:hypothetical protein
MVKIITMIKAKVIAMTMAKLNTVILANQVHRHDHILVAVKGLAYKPMYVFLTPTDTHGRIPPGPHSNYE